MEANDPLRDLQFFPPETVAFHWEAIEKELINVRHIWEDRFTLEYIYRGMVGGHFQTWASGSDETGHECIVVTQVNEYPTGRGLCVLFVLGNHLLEGLMSTAHELEKFAREHDCEFIEGVGRPGWKPFINQLGGHVTGLAYIKRLQKETIQ